MSSQEAYAIQGVAIITHAMIWILKVLKRRENVMADYLETGGLTKLFGVGLCTLVVLTVEEGEITVYPVRNPECIFMYTFIGISGIIDVLSGRHRLLPMTSRNTAYIFSLLVESVVFAMHIKAYSDADVHLHFGLLFVISCSIACEIAECRYMLSLSTRTVLCREFLALFHGLWIIVIGYNKAKQQ